MADINIILEDIEILRDKLSSLIQTKEELLDAEVLRASIMLDKALNEYDRCKYNNSEIKVGCRLY